MLEITININGGNNHILPNATHAELHFHYHGVEQPPVVESGNRETANDEDHQRLSFYINKEEDLDKYVSLLLPFLTHVTKDKGIDNLRCCINEARTSRRKTLCNIK